MHNVKLNYQYPLRRKTCFIFDAPLFKQSKNFPKIVCQNYNLLVLSIMES